MTAGLRIDIQGLDCGSALQMARNEGAASVRTVRLGPQMSPVSICRLTDVLYLPNALTVGQSLQIVGGKLVPVEAILDPFTLSFLKRRRLERGISLYDEAFQVRDVEQDVCILGNVFSRNFTHWHEELFKVCILEAADVGCDYVFTDLPAFARDALRLLGIPDSRIYEPDRPTRFRSAFYATAISYENVHEHPGVLWSLRRALHAATDPDAPGLGPRVWLERREQTRLGRSLVNAEEVHECLEEFGFERLDMGAIPLARQIEVARRMEVMAGLHGSQFVHSQLMPPGSGVVECFSPLYMNPTYTSIYHVLEHRYFQTTAQNTPVFPYAHGGDVRVDCLQLRVALRTACAR